MRTTRNIAAVFLLAAAVAPVTSLAMMPWPRKGIADVPNGVAAPFVGHWSMEQDGRPATVYATCKLPVRIRAADDTHIFYEGPKDREAEAATQLVARDGRTHWEPIAGGPRYFTVWVHPDRFHLYEAEVEAEIDWGEPYAFTRCD
ncbi:MAG TPA: hypothetical protein VIL88_00145 [Devosia sp.]|jgi:hypothetical protein|uniref:hypothetical protein n=1 Tax=Devosia sp. TaxID=1871048 RepID=UPI002F936EAA